MASESAGFDPDAYLTTGGDAAAAVIAGDVAEDAFEARKLAFAQTVPDYEQVVSKAAVGIPQHVTDFLKTSPFGPALGYHLAKNLEICRRIAWMPRSRVLCVLRRLESRLRSPRLRLVHCANEGAQSLQNTFPSLVNES